MAAIDLLFDHKPSSERVHQMALSALLLNSRLLERILGIPGLSASEQEWEPERRLYDLAFTVSEPNGSVERVYVELKVDGALEKEQFDRQYAHVKKTPRSRLVYLVLGLSQVTVSRHQLQQWAGPPAAGNDPSATLLCARCDAAELSTLLADPQVLSDGHPKNYRDVRDLAGAYRDVLRSLTARTERFADRPPSGWEPSDFYGFFADCQRRGIGQMGKSGISYAANAREGFIACHWKKTPIHKALPLRLYLQLEDAKLCLKLKVPDELKAQRKKLWDAAQAALRTQPSSPLLPLVPANYHSGVHMTVAALPDVFGGASLDRAAFADTISAAEALLQAVADKLLAAAST